MQAVSGMRRVIFSVHNKRQMCFNAIQNAHSTDYAQTLVGTTVVGAACVRIDKLPAALAGACRSRFLPNQTNQALSLSLECARLLSSSLIPKSHPPRRTWTTSLDVGSSIANSKTLIDPRHHVTGT